MSLQSARLFPAGVLLLLLVPGASACATRSGPAREPVEAVAARVDPRPVPPEVLGLASTPLEAITAVLRAGEEFPNLHALLIAKEGQLVYEEYFPGEDMHRGRRGRRHVIFERDTLHDLRSVTKSVVSSLVGVALADSAERMLDRPLLDFFPEHADLASPERRAITLRHALDMTAGLDWNERVSYADTTNDEVRMDRRLDPVRFVLERPVVTAPGSAWNYSGGLTQVLAGVVERVTGKRIDEFARTALFEPLDMAPTEWVAMENGQPSAASGLRLRPIDVLKFALMYQGGGVWNGRRVVPESWVRGTTRAIGVTDSIAEYAEGVVREGGYGRQWWPTRYTLPYGSFDVLFANGNGGQRIAIVPELALTIVSHAGNYNASSGFDRLLVERILPWAVGDTTHRFGAARSVRRLAPGELPMVSLSPSQRGLYVGTYDYERQPLRVLDQGGVLRVELPGARGELVDLIPVGDHVFLTGLVVDGEVRKLYWPDWRLDFEIVNGRAARIRERATDGKVFTTAERID